MVVRNVQLQNSVFHFLGYSLSLQRPLCSRSYVSQTKYQQVVSERKVGVVRSEGGPKFSGTPLKARHEPSSIFGQVKLTPKEALQISSKKLKKVDSKPPTLSENEKRVSIYTFDLTYLTSTRIRVLRLKLQSKS